MRAKCKTVKETETLRSSEKTGNIYPSTRRNFSGDVKLKKKTPISERQVLQLILGLAVFPSII